MGQTASEENGRREKREAGLRAGRRPLCEVARGAVSHGVDLLAISMTTPSFSLQRIFAFRTDVD